MDSPSCYQYATMYQETCPACSSGGQWMGRPQYRQSGLNGRWPQTQHFDVSEEGLAVRCSPMLALSNVGAL